MTKDKKCSICNGELYVQGYIDKHGTANFYLRCDKCDGPMPEDVMTPDDDKPDD